MELETIIQGNPENTNFIHFLSLVDFNFESSDIICSIQNNIELSGNQEGTLEGISREGGQNTVVQRNTWGQWSKKGQMSGNGRAEERKEYGEGIRTLKTFCKSCVETLCCRSFIQCIHEMMQTFQMLQIHLLSLLRRL